MPKTLSKAQLNRRGTPRLIRDVEALDKGYDTESLSRDDLINILFKQEEGDPVHLNADDIDARRSLAPREPTVTVVISPVPRVPGNKPSSPSTVPAAQKSTRKGKEKDGRAGTPSVRGTRSKLATAETKAKAQEPDTASPSNRITSSPGPNLTESRQVHNTEAVNAEQPGGLSLIVEEESSGVADSEMTRGEGITAVVDSLPSAMPDLAPRPTGAQEGENPTPTPHPAVEALHTQVARQDTVIADLQSEMKHLSSQFASVTGKQVDLPNVLDNATSQTSDVPSKLQEMVERLSSRIDDLEAKMDGALRELKEQRSDLVLLDKAAEVLYAQNKQLESRPLASRVVAYGVSTLPEHLKRKHGNSEEDAPPERPAKIFVTPGLAPGTRQWVEEGPSGIKIHTQTGLEPLEAAHRRDFGQ